MDTSARAANEPQTAEHITARQEVRRGMTPAPAGTVLIRSFHLQGKWAEPKSQSKQRRSHMGSV